MMNQKVSLSRVLVFYPELERSKVKTTWSSNKLYNLYLQGYKYCTTDNFLIKTEETYCRICRNKFRTRNRNKKRRKHLYAVPRKDPMIIDVVKGVII